MHRENLDRNVSIAIRYWLDGTGFESRRRDILFSLKTVHTGSVNHLATY
jgi:hypothetical protein